MITYNKQESTTKHEIREELFSKIDRLGKGPKTCITLPNLNFWLENIIIESYPGSKCYCYELNPFIYQEQKKINLSKNIKLINDDIFDCNHNKVYDFVWLDLCGGFTVKNIDNTINMLQNLKFSKRSIFALTLTTQRQDNAVDVYEKKFKNYKEIGIKNQLKKYIDGVLFTETIDYKCLDTSNKAQIMKVFVFTIRK